MPIGLQAERASRRRRLSNNNNNNNNNNNVNTTLSFNNKKKNESSTSSSTSVEEIIRIIVITIINQKKECSKEIERILLLVSTNNNYNNIIIEEEEEDVNDDSECFILIKALSALYWSSSQALMLNDACASERFNFEALLHDSILAGLTRFSENTKQSSSKEKKKKISIIFSEEARKYLSNFFNTMTSATTDVALESIQAISTLLSFCAGKERRTSSQTQNDDTIFNITLVSNADLILKQCKWVFETVISDISCGKNVSNVTACSDVGTLTQRMLRDYCPRDSDTVINNVLLHTLFDALEINIFGGTSVGSALVTHLVASSNDGDENFQIMSEGFGFNQEKSGEERESNKISLEFRKRVEMLSNLALAHLIRGVVAALTPEVLFLSTTPLQLARDGFFPILLNILDHCEDPHAIFHAVNAITTLLEKLTAADCVLLNNNNINEEEEYVSILSLDDSFLPVLKRISNALLTRWDDINITASTTREIANAFDKLCDCAIGSKSREEKNYNERGIRWGLETAQNILNVTFVNAANGAKKSRFKPLSSLTKRLGAHAIIKMRATILIDILEAMSKDDSLGPAASWFLIELSKSFHRTDDNSSFKSWWFDALIPYLLQFDGKRRRNVATHALPIAFQEEYGGDSTLAADLLTKIWDYGNDDAKISLHLKASAIVTVTRAARNAQLCDPNIFGRIQSQVVKSINNKKERRKNKRKEQLKFDNNAVAKDTDDDDIKYFDVPHSMIEIAALSSCVIARTDAMELLCWEGKGSSQTLPGVDELNLLKRILPHHMRGETSAQMNSLRTAISRLFERINFGLIRNKYNDDEHKNRLIEFTRWLLKKSVHGLYPSAPYERKATAIEILTCARNVMLSVEKSSAAAGVDDAYAKVISEELLHNKDTIGVLLKASMDSWDRLRKSAFDLLSALPSPLTGIETSSALCKHLTWAKAMILSPMVKESDAAALQVRLWIRKYVLELNWSITLVPEVSVVSMMTDDLGIADKKSSASSAISLLLETLADFIEVQLNQASNDVLAACKQSLAHGPLLLTRYALDELEFSSIKKSDNDNDMKITFDKLVDLIIRVTLLARENISTPHMLGVSASEVSNPNNSFAHCMLGDDDDNDGDYNDSCLSPDAQTIVTASWLTIKEVGLVVGTLASKTKQTEFLSNEALQKLGAHLISVILEVKHAGAIDKTRIGLTALCERLLDDRNITNINTHQPESGKNLSDLPMHWLTILINQEIVNKSKLSVKDRVRRSAGIPFAFLALLLSEKSSSMRPMLKYAVTELFKVLEMDKKDNDEEFFSTQIHAFNVLRVIFKDRELSLETSIYAAKGVELCINKMSITSQWEVRNAATLCFSSLVQKLTGIANSDNYLENSTSVKSQSKALHANDFFAKYPSLHTFFNSELELSAMDERNETYDDEHRETELRPSLNAILAILIRLKVNINNDINISLFDPSIFVDHLEACSSSKYMSIRDRCATAIAIVARPFERSRIITRALDEATYSEGYSNRSHGSLLRLLRILDILLLDENSKNMCKKGGNASSTVTLEIIQCAMRGLLQSCHLSKADMYGDDNATKVPALLSSTWLECAIMTLKLSGIVTCSSSSRQSALPSALLEVVDSNTSSIVMCNFLKKRHISEPGLSVLASVIVRRFVDENIGSEEGMCSICKILTENDYLPYEAKDALLDALLSYAFSDTRVIAKNITLLYTTVWSYIFHEFDRDMLGGCDCSHISLKLALRLLGRLIKINYLNIDYGLLTMTTTRKTTTNEELQMLCNLSTKDIQRNEECRVEAMRTWGVAISVQMKKSSAAREKTLYANICEFIKMLDFATLDWESASADVRSAVADALSYSELLTNILREHDDDDEDQPRPAVFAYTHIWVSLLPITLRLLEDEDEDVRISACRAVISAIDSKSLTTSLTVYELPQTEYVLNRFFSAVLKNTRTTKSASSSVASFFAKLLEEVCESSNTNMTTSLLFLQMKYKKSDNNNNNTKSSKQQKLFDKEEHPRKEKMLLAQMAMQAIYEDNNIPFISSALKKVGISYEGCVRNLERFCNTMKSENVNVITCVNEDADAFLYVTLNFIAVWMLSSAAAAAAADSSTAAVVKESFSKICSEFINCRCDDFVHPSLRQVVTLSAQMVASDEDRKSEDSSSPCFLLV